ncbi:4Fe-4S ferredoxin [Desulfosarcina widdelii]|uniref:4Fe-4S ferredoxin n=1 Tax=Desulfosarcina widdelii TaxID=947919 RepID=A0A5K7Z3T8_9BACT|nr:4Fe-4S binding protein [Desulfosarcina widdelii]BBO73144.1 4Fe-4S ferredoxin [Desulfosarcina widdelii]
MFIDEESCLGCGQCVPYCPVGAINLDEDCASIDIDECVECCNCQRWAECPADAIIQDELSWPRTIRKALSDEMAVSESTGITGRGTEEMKTNDVTGRIQPGMVAVAIEVGRPALGTRIAQVEKIAMAVAKLGIQFEEQNPVTSLISDPNTGLFKKEVLNEKVLSAILEFVARLDQLPDILRALEDVSKQIDTVFSLDVATPLNDDGSVPTDPYIKGKNIWVAPNGKTNIGIGRVSL